MYTKASGISSHAEGEYTVASGRSSWAGNAYCKASGRNSFAAGEYSEAKGRSQAVFGKYNIADTTSLFIIGKGSSTTKSNAFTIDASGNLWVSGDIYVGSTSGTNKDTGSKKIATEDFVNTAINEVKTSFILNSSTEGSSKKFEIKVYDDGSLIATEIVN